MGFWADFEIVTATKLNAIFALFSQPADVAAAVAVEAAAREAGDVARAAETAAETAARIAADAAEAAARTAAIGVEATARIAADVAEAAARIAGDAAAASALTAAIAGLLPFNVRALGAAGDGIVDDTAAIQAVIDQAEDAGGGAVALPPGTYKISQTLTIKRSGVRLVGAGFDCSHDYAANWPTVANTAPVASLLWAGANGGTMVSVAPVANADNGAGIGGNGVLDLVLQAGVYPFASVAAYGVVVAGGRAGEYRLFGLECSKAALSFQSLNRNPAWNNSTWFNTVWYVGARNVSTAGGAVRLDGVTGAGNSYDNTFHVIDALYSNGNAVDLFSADNNLFHLTRLQRIDGGTGAGIFFHSAAQADMPARANIFQLLSPGGGGVVSDATFTYPAYENKIVWYDPDENGAPATPVIGTGSTLFWGSTKRSGSCTFEAAMSASQTIPSGVWTKVNFDTAIVDEATWYDTANKVWKPRYPGTFLFSASVAITITVATGSAQIRLSQNGSGSAFRTARVNAATGTNSISIGAMLGLNGTTDFVEVDVFQDSGASATITASGDEGYYQGARVG